MRSYAAAGKDDEGMALKILTKAKDMPDAKVKLQRVYSYAKRKRILTFRNRAATEAANLALVIISTRISRIFVFLTCGNSFFQIQWKTSMGNAQKKHSNFPNLRAHKQKMCDLLEEEPCI